MKLSGSNFVFLAVFGCALTTRGATEYTRRNEAFAPSATFEADTSSPTVNPALQQKRANFPTVEKKPAALAERRAAVDVAETRAKKILTPDNQQLQPASRPPDLSPLNHQPARISTVEASRKPALVAKYQDRLAAANAVSFGRTSALDRAGAGRLNRFVFRHNPPEPLPSPSSAAPIDPAPAGSR